MEKGWIKTYDWVIKLLQTCDLAEHSRRMGLEQTPSGEVSIPFLDRTYGVTKDHIALVEQRLQWARGEEYEYNLKSALGYYLLSKAEGEPVGEYCTLGHFSGGVFNENSSAFKAAHRAFGEVYGRDLGKFAGVLAALGMEPQEGSRAGKHLWHYRLLPKLPIKAVYYEGDEDFPSRLELLYDKTAIRIFNFETLAVLNGSIVQGLMAMGTA